MKLLSSTVPKVTGKVFSRKHAVIGRLLTNWDDIMGEELSQKALPLKVNYRKAYNNKHKASATLDIACSSADSTILHYQKTLILERINRIFGEGWITDIRFVALTTEARSKEKALKRRPKPLNVIKANQFNETVQEIEDEELRLRLQSFGKALLQDEKT